MELWSRARGTELGSISKRAPSLVHPLRMAYEATNLRLRVKMYW